MTGITSIEPPSLSLLCAEPIRAFWDYCLSHCQSGTVSAGEPIPVIVYPGLIAGARSTQRLRTLLDKAGFITYDWGRGMNRGPTGDFSEWLGPLEEKLNSIYESHKVPVGLVGWSLGGIYARELAKRRPELVRAVVTLGTPFRSLATGTRAGGLLQWVNCHTPRMTPGLERRLSTHPKIPTTAIYSRNDGVVAWEACAIRRRGCVESVEVHGVSHLGMCLHPKVLHVVAERLRQDGKSWLRYGASVRAKESSEKLEPIRLH